MTNQEYIEKIEGLASELHRLLLIWASNPIIGGRANDLYYGAMPWLLLGEPRPTLEDAPK